MMWHEYGVPDQKCPVPDSQRRVLVAQDDGYIEMAYWNGHEFEFDCPTAVYGSAKPGTLPSRKISRVRYWCDLPDAPTEENT